MFSCRIKDLMLSCLKYLGSTSRANLFGSVTMIDCHCRRGSPRHRTMAHTPKVCQLVETEMILAPQSGCNRELGVQEVACTSDPT